jgi:hypothetical protein
MADNKYVTFKKPSVFFYLILNEVHPSKMSKLSHKADTTNFNKTNLLKIRASPAMKALQKGRALMPILL